VKSSAASARPHLNKWADEEQEAVRVVVVAPALAWRTGIRALLNVDERIQVIGEAASLSELELALSKFDVLVLAGSAKRLDELGAVLQGRELLSVLLLLEDEPVDTRVLTAFPLRAWGVLPMDASAEDLSAAVHALAEGLLVGSPALLGSLLAGDLAVQSTEDDRLLESLTEREAEVLQLLAQGLANKQIAAALGISEHTVKFHASAIFAKLGAASRTDAVRIGIRRGMIVL
jgi:DNA-binding NarL/FixJ family response regulator